MNLGLVWVGSTRESGFQRYIEDLVQRMNHWVTLNIHTVRAGPYRDSESLNVILEKEARRLFNILKPYSEWLLLDAGGDAWTTEQWFTWWLDRVMTGSKVALICGGPHGVHESIRRSARWQVSLGPIVMSHQLVRVVVVEQLYRVMTMWKGVPYAK